MPQNMANTCGIDWNCANISQVNQEHTQIALVRTGSCCGLPCSRRAFKAELAAFQFKHKHTCSISAAYPTSISHHLTGSSPRTLSYCCASPGLAQARSWRQQELPMFNYTDPANDCAQNLSHVSMYVLSSSIIEYILCISYAICCHFYTITAIIPICTMYILYTEMERIGELFVYVCAGPHSCTCHPACRRKTPGQANGCCQNLHGKHGQGIRKNLRLYDKLFWEGGNVGLRSEQD